MVLIMMMMMTAFDVLCAESTFPIVCGGKEKPITTLLPHNSHEESTAGDVLLLFTIKSTLSIGKKNKDYSRRYFLAFFPTASLE